MSGPLLWILAVGALVAVTAIALLVARSLKPRELTPAASEANDTWAQAMSDASAARPLPGGDKFAQPGAPREVFTRDALLNPERELDPNRWDNSPDGSEELDPDDPPAAGPAPGTVVDRSFLDELRRRES